MEKKSTAKKNLIWLIVIIVVLYGSIIIGHYKSDAKYVPEFALDLAGGTQLVLTPKLTEGGTLDEAALDQAIAVIRQRIDASGVAEPEITKQGGQNIVVGIPGETPSDATINLISKAAHMRFRPVIVYAEPAGTIKSAILGVGSAAVDGSNVFDATSQTYIPAEEAGEEAVTQYLSEVQTQYDQAIASDAGKGTTSGYDQITDEVAKAFDELDCTLDENRTGGDTDDPEKPLVSCDESGTIKYLLGPVSVEGSEIESASSGLMPTQNGGTTNEWVVSLKFKNAGDKLFVKTTEQVKTLDAPRNQFGIVLDTLTISAPSVASDANFTVGSNVQISGGGDNGFTQDSANTLANQLSFGALPMSFQVSSKEQISATLGSEQLEKGLLAGLIGLLLVVLYSMFQYRTLGLVTVGSLTIAGILTYGTLLLLSWQVGYRLSLSSIVGIIVAIGITADSFIVYFERIRDELRDGRSLKLAVSNGWHRAIRTILASDAVNFLAAFVLYFLAVGSVRGFAFTLGLTTLIDLFVVLLFTHPIVEIISKRRFFAAGHPASGLSTVALGSINAVPYEKLSREEKAEIKARKRDAAAAKKARRKDQRALTNDAYKKRKKSKQISKSHTKQKRLEVLESVAEDQGYSMLTVAERKELKRLQGLKDVDSSLAGADKSDKKSSDSSSGTGLQDKEPTAKSASTATKKSDAKTSEPASSGKSAAAKPAASKSAATGSAAAKKPAAAKKTVAKPASSTAAKKPSAATKPAAKKTVAKPAAKTASSTAAKKPAAKKAPAKSASVTPKKTPAAKKPSSDKGAK
jgi:preprotein translocase subunit SecD